jgi:nitrile hydratase beta subunit
MNGVHDMGGMHGFGPIERDEAPYHFEWEVRVRAMNALAQRVGLFNVDEFRHGIERMAPADYLRASYFERWQTTLETNLIDKGHMTREEIEARVAQYERDPAVSTPRSRRARPSSGAAPADPTAPPSPRFAVGDRVVTRNVHPAGHTRLPRYARGKHGQIDRLHGIHTFPDANAHGRGPQPQPLYSVRFDAEELWGPSADGRGAVYLDLWQSYLDEEAT